ncbi:type IV pilus secretin PilQ family protein [Parasalinivibrio latis]|uniref:type IV pilus secretin PilQ n=1 Tax=Parasalinivibrio latis TaxID=2952610 RepID=UPI0030E56BE1
MAQLKHYCHRLTVAGAVLAFGLALPVSASETASNTSPRIEAVDFSRTEAGEGHLVIDLNSQQVAASMERRKEGLLVTLKDTRLPEDMLYVLDVVDFATPVTQVESFIREKDAQFLLTVKGPYGYHYDQKGKRFTVVIGKQAKQPKVTRDRGKPVSFNFQDIPVRTVLQIIADHSGFNLVVSDSVSGNLTMRLDNVPWKQALDTILKINGLDKRIDGNVILVAPKADLDRREQQELEISRKAEELSSLRSEVITINYAKAQDIATLLSGAEDGISMLTARGAVSVDSRTNSLVIRDLQENLQVIRDLVTTLDIPVKQVEIEARIVTVDDGTLDEIGVRWGVLDSSSMGIGGSIESNLAGQGLYEGIGNSGGGSEGGSGGEGGDSGGGSTTIDDFLNVNLGATDARASSIAFQVAKLGSDFLLDMELSALQAESKAEIISSPRLLTTNKMAAYIEQGTELPYLEAASSGATSISFKKAVLSLSVTPQITPDNKLVLDLQVTQDRPGQTVKAGGGEAVAIDTQRIGTQVLVDNGETVVLGGIYQHEVRKGVDKVPLLGDIPGLGALFRRTYDKLAKRELLIFVTPKIIVQ